MTWRSGIGVDAGGEGPTVEVRVFRDGSLVARSRCESAEEADAVVEAWSDLDGVAFEVDDLSNDHGAAAALEGDLVPPDDVEARAWGEG